MAYLIVNADDLGADPHVDEGIIEAFRKGIVTSATLLVTFARHWEESARTARQVGLPTGLHLSLTHGFAAAPWDRIPDLVDERGRFVFPARRLIAMGFRSTTQDDRIYQQIQIELDAQIELVQRRGLTLSHVDSHQHVHMNPRIFRLVEDAAMRHGIQRMRFVREPFFGFQLRHGVLENVRRNNFLKALLVRRLAGQIEPRLSTNDRFFGVMQSDTIDRWSFTKFLRSIAGTNLVWEAGIHPGHPGRQPELDLPGEVGRWFQSRSRQRELDVVMDPRIKELVRKEQIQLISYATMP